MRLRVAAHSFGWLIALGIIQDGPRFRFTQLKLGAHLLNLRRLLFQFCFESLNFLLLLRDSRRVQTGLEPLECMFSYRASFGKISPACRGNLQQARTGGIKFRTVFLIVHAQLRNA
jgi:hypothetical protein